MPFFASLRQHIPVGDLLSPLGSPRDVGLEAVTVLEGRGVLEGHSSLGTWVLIPPLPLLHRRPPVYRCPRPQFFHLNNKKVGCQQVRGTVELLVMLPESMKAQGLPWQSSGWDSGLPLHGAWVLSLVRELRSPHAAWHREKKKNEGIEALTC